MVTVTNAPIIQAFFNEQKSKRQERRVFTSPLSELTKDDHVLIDVALNSVVAEDSVLPHEIEKSLMLTTGYFYQVSTYKNSEDYNTAILVDFDGTYNRLNIYVYDKILKSYTVKRYAVVTPTMVNTFITSNITKIEYNDQAIRLTKEAVFQYSGSLSPIYSILFHVVFQTALVEPNDIDAVKALLIDLLQNTEITLHLNLTQTVKLYGEIDAENFLKLNIREIGSPDTYWSRMVLLPELLDRSLR